ncbi:MAG TPA: FMN-binding protein [Oscillospiraceae bacterium]|nr:FMN-binding protein [Oscillospiraceae bacterium]
MKDIVRSGLILMLICALSAGMLSYTHGVTSEIIEARIAAEKIALMQELFPAVATTEDQEVDGRSATVGYDESGKVVGILAEGKATGYRGDIRFNLAIDGTGKLVNLNIISHSETASLGSRIEEEAYRAQYEGKTVNDSFDVDNISGATVTSVAMERGVASEMKEILLRFGEGLVEPVPSIDITQLADGTYEGSGEGLKSTITVAVTVAGGKITAVEIVSGNDTEEYYTKAKKEVPARIVEEQKVDVDAASGATISSEGIKDAVLDALQKPPVLKLSEIADGTYEGSGEGLKSTITVEVTVAGGKITAVEVVSGNDTEEYYAKAKKEVPARIVEEQKVDVDAASGATISSEGIKDAVRNALQQ